MDALLEISKEMAGNINSMPDPPEKVIATAMVGGGFIVDPQS
jgi:phosphotransferase system IIA component